MRTSPRHQSLFRHGTKHTEHPKVNENLTEASVIVQTRDKTHRAPQSQQNLTEASRLIIQVQGPDDGELAGAFRVRPAVREDVVRVHGHSDIVPQAAVLALEGAGQLLRQRELEGEVVRSSVKGPFVVNLFFP